MTQQFDPERQQLVLKAHLAKMRGAIAEVLPRHLTPERLTKVVLSCTARTPGLLKCNMQSIARCVMQAAELGLELGGLLGEAYLIPYGAEAQIIIGYQGLLKLARQSGEVKNISSRVVYGGEMVRFDFAQNKVYDELTMADLAKRDESDENIVGAYAIVTLTSGEQVLEVVTRNQIDRIRSRSRASASGPWVTDFAAMCRKTVLRRVSKYIPKSAEQLKTVLEREEAIETGVIDVGGLGTPEPSKAATAGLTDAIMQRATAYDDEDDGIIDDEAPSASEMPPVADSRPSQREPGED